MSYVCALQLCGAPLKIQATFAERNRAWEDAALPAVDRGVVGVGGMKVRAFELFFGSREGTIYSCTFRTSTRPSMRTC